jgi:hypothetical protein
MNVTYFGETIRLLFTPRSINAALILGGIIDHSVQVSLSRNISPSSLLPLTKSPRRPQAFFVMRIYRVTGALYVSIGLWAMVVFLQGVSITLAQRSIHFDSIPIVVHNSNWLLSALFFGDASLDIVMASVLIYYLTQQKRSAFKKR